jgi:predicted PurR-regulated permease PerM
VILVLGIWFVRDVLLLAFAGVLVALLLRAPADWLSHRTGMPGVPSVALVCVLVLGILTGLFVWQGPSIAEQARELGEELPVAIDALEARLRQYDWVRNILDNLPEPSQLLNRSQGTIARATGILSQTALALVHFTVILFVGLVLALGPATYVRNTVRLVPPRGRERARDILDQLANTLRWWLLGRLIAMTAIGLLTWIGLALLGIPLAGVLAVVAALLSFVPNIGPILSAIPAILLGLVESPQLALAVAGVYAAVQFIESYILDPVLDRKTVYLPPALTVVAQLIMALAAGILGVALATPLLAGVVVLVRTLYLEDALGDRNTGKARGAEAPATA